MVERFPQACSRVLQLIGRSEWFQASYVQRSRTENVSGGKIKNIFVSFARPVGSDPARETVTISIYLSELQL